VPCCSELGDSAAIQEMCQEVRLYPIITVDKTHPLSPCVFQSEIACRTDAAVGFVKNADTGVLLRIFIGNSAATVRASVVNQQQFKITNRLI